MFKKDCQCRACNAARHLVEKIEQMRLIVQREMPDANVPELSADVTFEIARQFVELIAPDPARSILDFISDAMIRFAEDDEHNARNRPDRFDVN